MFIYGCLVFLSPFLTENFAGRYILTIKKQDKIGRVHV